MKAVRLAFLQMLSFLRRDMMLAAACIAPVLIGFLFRFGLPALEKVLVGYFHMTEFLAPYYEIFDIFFSMLSPFLFCYVAAMIILEERDEKIAKYLFVTPLRKNGYLIARIGLPCAAAFAVTVCLLPPFKLTALGAGTVVYLSLAGALQGMLLALLIVTLSSNKLEGMAVTKLSSVMILGVLVPYFVSGKIQYMFAFLPAFWVGRAVHFGGILPMGISIIISLAWIALLIKRLRL